MIDFPANPTLGQQFTAVGVTWTWDGTKWAPAGVGVAYLPLTGGTLTGPLTLAGDPVNALDASTKQYVDTREGMNDNRIINGDMRIDQRNGGASGAATNVYTVDRWQYFGTQTGKGTWGRNLASITGPAGFPYCLGYQSSSAYTPLAGDNFGLTQAIEADMASDFAWGTASAQPVTLSFWARHGVTGTFGGVIQNYSAAGPPTRSYPFTYSIPTAATWTKIVITIPGDTAGTWVVSGSGGGLYIVFDLGSGATFRAPAGAWANGNFVGANGSVNLVANNGAGFFITGVKLEIGSVATPFNRQSLAKSLADCQRYFEQGIATQGFYGLVGSFSYMMTTFAVPKRANPTITYSNPAFGNATAIALNGAMQNCFTSNVTVTTANNAWVTATFQASAEL